LLQDLIVLADAQRQATERIKEATIYDVVLASGASEDSCRVTLSEVRFQDAPSPSHLQPLKKGQTIQLSNVRVTSALSLGLRINLCAYSSVLLRQRTAVVIEEASKQLIYCVSSVYVLLPA